MCVYVCICVSFCICLYVCAYNIFIIFVYDIFLFMTQSVDYFNKETVFFYRKRFHKILTYLFAATARGIATRALLDTLPPKPPPAVGKRKHVTVLVAS